MSNIEKISFHDLADAVAQQTKISKKKSEMFLRAFQSAIEEGLITDREVKIKGLGKFKLTWNEARKSINVHTGEAFTIAGHHKVSFTPETALRDLINAPYQKLQEINVNEKPAEQRVDPIQQLGKDAEEIKSLIADLYQADSPAPKPKEEATEEKPAPIPPKEKEEPKEIKEETVPVAIADINSILQANPSNKVLTLDKQPHLQERTIPVKKSNKKVLKIVLLIVMLLALLGGGGYLLWKNGILRQTADWTGNQIHKAGNQIGEIYKNLTAPKSDTKPVETKPEPQPAAEPQETDTVKPNAVPAKVEEPAAKSQAAKSVFEQERTYTSFIGSEILEKGTRLTLIAEKYYGNRAYWVYIYEANRSTIPNPNNIAIGTKLRIPKLPAELIDVNNPQTIEYAVGLEKMYVKK